MTEVNLKMGDRVVLHVNHRNRRTTISVDLLLYEYFSMSIGNHPSLPNARRDAEIWLEDRMKYFFREKPSVVARYLMTAEIAKPELENQIQKSLLTDRASPRS